MFIGITGSTSMVVTWQRDAFRAARVPLAVLVHGAALAAGFLVAHVHGVVLGANVIIPYGPLGNKKTQASTKRASAKREVDERIAGRGLR